MRLLSKEIFGIRDIFYTKMLSGKLTNDIVYFNNTYIIACNKGSIAFTTNCHDYSVCRFSPLSDPNASQEEFVKIIQFNDKCVAIGKNGYVAFGGLTPDNWEIHKLNTTKLCDIATDNEKIVILASQGKLFVSYDLENWEEKYVNSDVPNGSVLGWDNLLFDGTQFVVSTNAWVSFEKFFIKTSNDLVTWSSAIGINKNLDKMYYFNGNYFFTRLTGYFHSTILSSDIGNIVFTGGIPQKIVCYNDKLYIICNNGSSLEYHTFGLICIVRFNNLGQTDSFINVGQYNTKSIVINDNKIVCCSNDLPNVSTPVNGYISYKYNGK